jgi:hypothetical protein
MLVTWLLEIHLSELADSRCGSASAPTKSPQDGAFIRLAKSGATSSNQQSAAYNHEQHRKLIEHCHQFMARRDVMVLRVHMNLLSIIGVLVCQPRCRIPADE